MCDGYCLYFEKVSQICNTHHKTNSDAISKNKWFMMGIAVIKVCDASFLVHDGYCTYLKNKNKKYMQHPSQLE